MKSTAGLYRAIGIALLAGGCAAGASTTLSTELPPGSYTPIEAEEIELSPAERPLRDAALRRAQVWRAPDRPIASAVFDRNPPGPWGTADQFACRYLPGAVRGTTGKFDCVVAGGEVVKVKYAGSGEIPGEVAASRLLRAIGFGADTMYVMRRVRCFGCPREPFLMMKVLQWVALRDAYVKRMIDYTDYRDFEWVAVERRFDAAELEVDDQPKGWSFFELDAVAPKDGGAPRAHVDGLRMMAMLLHHWDNKSENQRLVCLDGSRACAQPFAFMHDLGSTFGPHKVHFDVWRKRPVWQDSERCVVSMKGMPYNGGTFGEASISEEGRRWIAAKLTAISDTQLRALFAAARFPEHMGARDRDAEIERWVGEFKNKVRQIADRPPCPPS